MKGCEGVHVQRVGLQAPVAGSKEAEKDGSTGPKKHNVPGTGLERSEPASEALWVF